jgi:hypothetical protein
MWVVWKNILTKACLKGTLTSLKNQEADIAVCKAAIPDRYLARYQVLYDSGKERINLKKRLSKSIGESVALLQENLLACT